MTSQITSGEDQKYSDYYEWQQKNENNGAATQTIALLSVFGLPDRLHAVSQLLLEKRACPGILGFSPFVFGPVKN